MIHHLVKGRVGETPPDNWYSIARLHSVAYADLRAANPEHGDLIHPGLVLHIPPTGSAPPPPPPPPPPPTGSPSLRDAFGLRTRNDRVTYTEQWVDLLGFVPTFWRETGDRFETSLSTPMWSATSGWWRAQFTDHTDPEWGLFHHFPTMRACFAMPQITGPESGLTTAERVRRHQQVVDGEYDQALANLVELVSDGREHIFCIGWEAELSSYPHRKLDVPEDLWRASFKRVSDVCRFYGHQVAYTGDGPWNSNSPDPARKWWQYAMPDPDDFDLFGPNLYPSSQGLVPTRLSQFETNCQIAADLDKAAIFGEVGIRFAMSDSGRIDYWSTVADILEASPAPIGAICFWDHQESVMTTAERAFIAERFAA